MTDESSHYRDRLTPQTGKAEDSFFSILRSYQDKIFRYALFRTNDREVALDITQDVFASVWRYLASGKSIEYEEAFVYRIAKNAIIDFFKKRKALSLDFLEESGFDAKGDDGGTLAEKNSELAYVLTLIDELDEEQKQLIHLRYVEELSLEEIATLFERTPNAIAVRLHRIIAKLKERYK